MTCSSLPRFTRVASLPLTVAAALLLAGCAADSSTAPTMRAAAAHATRDYGPGAVYQVEISSNVTGKNGGGVWLWIELNADGTGDYAGSDCGRGAAHASSDRGDITSWSVADGVLTINGVVLNGFGGLPVTITIPLPSSGYGHVSTDVVSIFPDLGTVLGLPPGAGFSQVEVAP